MNVANQAELEEEEAISGTGEGDEIMEEVEEQEDGYSTCFPRIATTSSNNSIDVIQLRQPLPPH